MDTRFETVLFVATLLLALLGALASLPVRI